MNAKEFYEFQLNDRTSVVGRQDKEEIVMLMEEYYKYKVKNCNKPAVINNEAEASSEGVAVCDHHWLGVGNWDGYAMEQCTKCNLFREAN